MERGAEPWSWVLETSSASSHDFHPGVVLRREGSPHPSPSPSSPQGPSSPCLGWSASQVSLQSETGEGSMCVFRSGFWGHGTAPSHFPAQTPEDTP